MAGRKQLFINMTASFITLAVTTGINFYLSPFIVKNVGLDAYGFIGLANNFISYASVITLALNSMAGRFITIEYYNGEIKTANKYYTSVVIANIIFSSVILLLSIPFVYYLEYIIKIPLNLVSDVKALFSFLIVSFIFATVTSVYSIGTFIKNKLYLSSIRTVESSIFRALLLVSLFMFLNAKLFYLGCVGLITSVYTGAFNFYYTKKLVPELVIDRRNFDIKSIVEILKSGIWNTVTRVGQLLLEGVDLLVTNIFISSSAMGLLSIAKIIPSFISSLVSILVGNFMPGFTKIYAQGDIKSLAQELKHSIVIMSFIVNIPIVILMTCGDVFYKLWIPNQDYKYIQLLSILSVAGYIINGGINCIYNIFTVTNKLKFNSLLLIANGGINILVVFILLKTTDLGLIAVAGTSTVLNIIKNFVFIIPYAAKCLKLKWYTFYPEVIKSVAVVVIVSSAGIFLKGYLHLNNTWIHLVLLASIIVVLSISLNMLFVFSKYERTQLLSIIKGITRK